jgi:hypothetical protein
MNPEYTGHDLDFMAITDHNSVAALSYPDFNSERLILVGGEEWGGGGHANCLGIRELVVRDADGDGMTQDDVTAAIAHTRDQGGVFSVNHPMLADIPFGWDLRNIDALEVWNSGFGLADPELTHELLLEWETSHGPANPFTHRAAQVRGQLASGQNLALFEALLSRGEHPALLGGSDRHTILLPGFPATWVLTESPDEAGIIQGIRDRRTFVNRGPAAAQVLLEVRRDDRTYGLGDHVPVPTAGVEIAVRVRVGRGTGARVRLVAGGPVDSDEALAAASLGRVALEEEVTSGIFATEVRLMARPGDWVYPSLHEPLVQPGADPQRAAEVREFAAKVAATGSEDFAGLADLVLDYIDTEVLFDSSLCDPRDWEADRPQCRPEDPDGLSSYFLPDWMDRIINVTLEDSEITDWSLTAVGSAIRFVEEPP